MPGNIFVTGGAGARRCLPISARADEITAAIAEHQVVILAGETGSGKTTQIPKMCLAAGRGQRGRNSRLGVQ